MTDDLSRILAPDLLDDTDVVVEGTLRPRTLDVMIGKGPSARSLRLSLKPFTVVGATTRAGRISGPLRDRFGATYRLDFYEEDDLAAIVDRSARILDVAIDDAAARAIARRG